MVWCGMEWIVCYGFNRKDSEIGNVLGSPSSRRRWILDGRERGTWLGPSRGRRNVNVQSGSGSKSK